MHKTKALLAGGFVVAAPFLNTARLEGQSPIVL